MTVAVAVEGRSGEAGRGVAGAGVVASCARIGLNERMQAAASNADRLTLMLTPNLSLFRVLETVCAVDRYTVLIVITQEHVRIFARALIAEAKGDVWGQLIAKCNCTANS